MSKLWTIALVLLAGCAEQPELSEIEQIERECVAAQQANPDQLSCDWDDLEGARFWQRQHRSN